MNRTTTPKRAGSRVATQHRWSHLAIATVLLVGACSDSSATPPASVTSTPTQPTTIATGFDDHTRGRLDSLSDYQALARTGDDDFATVKFTIPNMLVDDDVVWLDSNFYSLHDEWYWFRLLNGQTIPSADVEPVTGMSFDSIDAIYQWAADRTALPIDLRWVDKTSVGRRLYSPQFYVLGLQSEPRNYGLGSLVRVAPGSAGDDTRWLIELEYSDDPSPEEVALFFERLSATLPDEIGSNLEWVIRSPHQEVTAQTMAASSLPYHDRVVRFGELTTPGEVRVYNEGLTAGRLLLIDEGGNGAQLADATETDIVLVENVPDWLPPASALLSSSPQTPLAHVNLLARNRGIPNASQAGLLDDVGIRQAALARAPAIVRASGDELDVVLLTSAEYLAWQRLQVTQTIAVPPVDIDAMANLVGLDALAATISTEADIDDWRPVIGGKAAGFLTLLAAEDVTTPHDPLVITVKPYLDHLDRVSDALDAVLANREFQSSARIRYLLLEGASAYADFYADDSDALIAEQFQDAHRSGTLVGDVLDAGGFVDYFRDEPMDPSTLAELTAALEATYGDYAVTQGLRFRSSSSVEDIEGFSGAGLYDSNTGFLHADQQPDEGDHKRTIEYAVKKTWASYWGFEAFEERRLESVDHRSGAMAVLVHARFDDALEQNNGVATFTLLPGGNVDDSIATINVQVDDISVTNPDPTRRDLPEVIEVQRAENGSLRIERVSPSTLANGTEVLDDQAVRELFAQLEAVALLWRDRINIDLPPQRRIETLTLDYEFKTMAEGWPARDDDSREPGRLVLKQARSLDPGLRDTPADVRALPVPSDILARARLVVRLDCRATDGSTTTSYEVLTDPLLVPDVGYSRAPFLVGGEPTGACERTILFSTPDQYLLEVLAATTQPDLTG